MTPRPDPVGRFVHAEQLKTHIRFALTAMPTGIRLAFAAVRLLP